MKELRHCHPMYRRSGTRRRRRAGCRWLECTSVEVGWKTVHATRSSSPGDWRWPAAWPSCSYSPSSRCPSTAAYRQLIHSASRLWAVAVGGRRVVGHSWRRLRLQRNVPT